MPLLARTHLLCVFCCISHVRLLFEKGASACHASSAIKEFYVKFVFLYACNESTLQGMMTCMFSHRCNILCCHLNNILFSVCKRVKLHIGHVKMPSLGRTIQA